MEKLKRRHYATAVLAIGIAGAVFFQDKSQAQPISPVARIMRALPAMHHPGAFLSGAAGRASGEKLDLSVETQAMSFAAPAAKMMLPRPERHASKNAPRKIVRNGSISIEVSDYARAHDELLALAVRHQAEVLQDEAHGDPERRSGFLSLKVPPHRLEALLAEISGKGRLLGRTVSATDMGEEYVDLRSRLENARKVEKRLNDLLAFKTTKLADVLQVEKELERVGGEIERLLGRMKYIDALEATSRLTVSLEEPVKQAPPAGIGTDLRNRLVAAVGTFVRTGLSLVSFTGFLVAVGLWAAALGGAFWAARRAVARFRRRPEPAVEARA